MSGASGWRKSIMAKRKQQDVIYAYHTHGYILNIELGVTISDIAYDQNIAYLITEDTEDLSNGPKE